MAGAHTMHPNKALVHFWGNCYSGFIAMYLK